jgi:antagonist of KipI
MTLLIEKEGLFTSIQDLGQFGLQRFGVNPRGAMDTTAVRIINLLLGNDDEQPVLEFHFPGPEIVFEDECRFALGGADLAAELDGDPVTNWQTHPARKSSVLRFRRKAFGNRCYLSIDGGLTLASDLANGGKAFATERLRKGQTLVRNDDTREPARTLSRGVSRTLLPVYSPFPTVRIVAGAEFTGLSNEHKELVETADFTVSNESNRMGFRLAGPPLKSNRPIELVSAAVSFGTIQLLPDGQLIVLMADHQTSGGYPRVGHVISVDLPLVAQLGPGDKIAFKIVDIDEAERAAERLETDLNKLRTAVSFGRYW